MAVVVADSVLLDFGVGLDHAVDILTVMAVLHLQNSSLDIEDTWACQDPEEDSQDPHNLVDCTPHEVDDRDRDTDLRWATSKAGSCQVDLDNLKIWAEW